MFPLLLPADLPCDQDPYVSVRLAAGESFGWTGLAGAMQYDTDHRWRGPSHEVATPDGMLRCAATEGPYVRGTPVGCHFVVPVRADLPKRVSVSGLWVHVTYECDPYIHSPRVSWSFPTGWADVGVVYSGAAELPSRPRAAEGDDLADARRVLERARDVMSMCSPTRCSDAVTARRRAVDAALAAPSWRVAERRRPPPWRGREARSGDLQVISTGLDWATVRRNCGEYPENDREGCETSFQFYDSTLFVYGTDHVSGEVRLRWETGSVSVADGGLLNVTGDAVVFREM